MRPVLGSRRQRQNHVCRMFKFGKNGADASEAMTTMTKEDFDEIEMEQYFNYTGRLAVEQNYDSYNRYLKEGTHPVDVILLWAAEDGDMTRVEECLGAGANINVKNFDGKTPLELADKEEVKEMLQKAAAA